MRSGPSYGTVPTVAEYRDIYDAAYVLNRNVDVAATLPFSTRRLYGRTMRAGQITQAHCTYRVRVTRDLGGSLEDGIAGALLAVAHDQQGTTLRVEVLNQNVELRVSAGYEVEVIDDNGRAITS